VVGDYVEQPLLSLLPYAPPWASKGAQRATIAVRDGTEAGEYRLCVRTTLSNQSTQVLTVELGPPQ